MPKLGRTNIVSNSFGSCIPDASEEFSWAPEMLFSEIISEPWMLLQKFKGAAVLRQLNCFAHKHCLWKFDKQLDVVNSYMKSVNFTSILDSNFMDEPFTIDANFKKFEMIYDIFTFPHEMKSILPEGMFKRLQIHFLSPFQSRARELMLNKCLVSDRGCSKSLSFKEFQELNLVEEGNSSLGLKAEVSLPFI